jgi:hypothetical protein
MIWPRRYVPASIVRASICNSLKSGSILAKGPHFRVIAKPFAKEQ